ncbi:hypothetical protein NE237_021580 [Protea cynaroides]|uniref:Cytidyltransferase-like domain-containing protein n=1 Tax=Protea cynaroides TaxID=273540 RepID=A0A9Q0K4H3_9MAGN|nr:hypothetical protein NE237_021580 [Protea cynaroides]
MGNNELVSELEKASKKRLVRKPYSFVVLGAIFDRLHVAHRLLLKRVCDGPVLIKKEVFGLLQLADLIEPIEMRMKIVGDYIKSIKPGLKVETKAIIDPYGPSVVGDKLDSSKVKACTLRLGIVSTFQEKKKTHIAVMQYQKFS